MTSFIDSPFPTKAEHEAYLQMPTDEAAAALRAAAKRAKTPAQQQRELERSLQKVAPESTEAQLARTILVPTDYSENAEAAYPFAKAYAEKLGAVIVLVHVTEDSGFPSWWLNSEEKERAAKRPPSSFSSIKTDEARSKLGPLLKDCVSAHGVPSVEICKIAEMLEICFIIIATHGHSKFIQAVRPSLGSVAERVVRLASCPVLTVHADDNLPTTGMKIVLATDFSKCAINAYPLAAQLAKWFDAEIMLCYVEYIPTTTRGTAALYHQAKFELREDARKEAAKVARAMAAQGVKTEFKFMLSSGFSVSNMLEDAAKEHAADLIVIATHGSTSVFDRFIIGSVAESVLRNAKRPVFAVH